MVLGAPPMHLTPRDNLISAVYERGLQQGSQQCSLGNAPISSRAKPERQLTQEHGGVFNKKSKSDSLSLRPRAEGLDPTDKYPNGLDVPREYRELPREDVIHAFGIAVGFCMCQSRHYVCPI